MSVNNDRQAENKTKTPTRWFCRVPRNYGTANWGKKTVWKRVAPVLLHVEKASGPVHLRGSRAYFLFKPHGRRAGKANPGESPGLPACIPSLFTSVAKTVFTRKECDIVKSISLVSLPAPHKSYQRVPGITSDRRQVRSMLITEYRNWTHLRKQQFKNTFSPDDKFLISYDSLYAIVWLR